MKKELKDYLHLYLGCEVQVRGGVPILSGVSYDEKGKYFVHLIDKEFGYFILFIEEIKPILRPLSDMTEDEEIEMNGSDRLLTDGLEELEYDADRTRYILSKHFDLFGLIESGLALNSTTIKQ